MSKAVGETTAYWPEGLERSVPVPYEFLFNIVSDRLKTGRIWIRNGQRELGPDELYNLSSHIASFISTQGYTSVACLCSDRLNVVATVLGSFLAGVKVHIDEQDSPTLASRINAVSPDILITDGSALPRINTNAKIIRFEEVFSAKKAERFEPKIQYASFSDPILMLPVGDDAAQHTHTSLLAMIMSFDKFFDVLGAPVIVFGRLSRWHGVLGLLSMIFGEAPLVLGPSDPNAVESGYLLTDVSGLTLLRRELASKLRYVFVALDEYSRASLRQIYNLGKKLGVSVIPLLGCQESGPLIAPHPTWIPTHALGIPLVNVTPVPMDPDTGRMLKIPWHLLEMAELGVDTPANMLGYISEERTRLAIIDGVVRTGYVMFSDALGLFYLSAILK